MKIKKGDTIQILLGKDRGKTGTVDSVDTKERTVKVGGINLFTKHIKPIAGVRDGGRQQMSRAIGVSKVALVCPKCKKVTRVGFEINDDKKSRVCRKCKAQI